ncbi:hypothetical protein ILUMI_09308 [Ignelater luminosus]|uniref:Uncharacterized protein n=1 Tax=Ignelater luminosus TaxID=2038154 RepID=A0A8K0D2N6_IGNLU|nr:hypothetical protein ILUMI_09308 [Ignelater luminosus]
MDSKPKPPAKEKRRKRVAQRHLWKRNIKKLKVNSGLAYISVGNKPVPARGTKSPCNDKCRLKCPQNLGTPKTKEMLCMPQSNGKKKRTLKSGPIYVPSQWLPVIRSARKSKPYKVNEMATEEFFDFHDLSQNLGKSFSVSVKGEKVIWNDIQILKVAKDSSGVILYKNSYNSEEFKEIKVLMIKRGRSSSSAIYDVYNLKPAYRERPTISDKTKSHLMELCQKNLIPKEDAACGYCAVVKTPQSFGKRILNQHDVERNRTSTVTRLMNELQAATGAVVSVSINKNGKDKHVNEFIGD